MVRGMDFTPHIVQTFSNPDRKWHGFFCFELFGATPEEVDPKVPDLVLRLPLNLQPSHLKLHQKDVVSTSVAVPIQGAFCIASYPNSIAGGIDLREVVSWALLCCASADGNYRAWESSFFWQALFGY